MRLKLPLRIVTLVCAVSLLAYACGDSTSPVEGKPVSLTLLPDGQLPPNMQVFLVRIF